MTKTEELYNFLKIKPKEKIICNALNKCTNTIKDCSSCGLALKTEKYEITEKQQLAIIKLYINFSLLDILILLQYKQNYEEGISEMVLGTWKNMPKEMKESIERILNDRG